MAGDKQGDGSRSSCRRNKAAFDCEAIVNPDISVRHIDRDVLFYGGYAPERSLRQLLQGRYGLLFVVSGNARHFFFRTQVHRYALVQAFRLDVENTLMTVRGRAARLFH